MKLVYGSIIIAALFSGCGSDDSTNNLTEDRDEALTEEMYFPPNDSGQWETKGFETLGWNEAAAGQLADYLEEKNTKGFILLHNGRIVMEKYFNGHTENSPWYWASAGKTLTATVTGIATGEGLEIDAKVSDYLGVGWTSAPAEKESLITVKHLLTMTSGLDDTTGDNTDSSNLLYKADAGTRWAYANVYVKLQDVVAQYKNTTWDSYFETMLIDRIGMDGEWRNPGGNLKVYFSTTRSMARFGLLMLNRGKWKNEVVLNEDYFAKMIKTSQDINKAYGYLCWLNGKESFHLPQTQQQFSGSIIPGAPVDMYAALGKNDQKIYIVPSKKLIIIRMGDAADGENFALSDFDVTLWQKINAVIEKPN